MAKKISKTNPQPRSAPSKFGGESYGKEKRDALSESIDSQSEAIEEEMSADQEILEPVTEEVEVVEVVEEIVVESTEESETEEVAVVESSVTDEENVPAEEVVVPAVAMAEKTVATKPRIRLGKQELIAAAGFLVFALVTGSLFFKFLYAHSAPLAKEEVSRHFVSPLKGGQVTLESAAASWKDRTANDRAQGEETVLPTVVLALPAGQTTSGFVRVEFVDTEGKIRGDVYVLTVEAGKFRDTNRGEVVENEGRQATVSGTVGFRTHALYAAYSTDDEPRWSVRIKDGADGSSGPWNLLGNAEVPNK